MISIALLGGDEVWVSLYKEGEAGGRTSLTPSRGGQEQSKVAVVERGKRSLEGSDPLDPKRGTVQCSSGEVTGEPGEGKRRERIPKGPLPALAHSTGCSEQSQKTAKAPCPESLKILAVL